MRRPGTLVLGGTLLLVLVAGCGGKKSGAPQTKNGCLVVTAQPSKAARSEAKPTRKLSADRVYDITMTTSCGSFTFQLDQAESPNAAASFVSLVRHRFFDRTIFHRIVPDFIIQGGDPTASGNGGPGYTTIDIPPKTARYTHGVVAMAKTQLQPPGAAGSQFFVVTVPNANLPPDYAIVGKVIEGLAVVDHIGTFGTPGDEAGAPTQTVEVERATVKVT